MVNLSNIRIKKVDKDITSIIINEPKTYNALSFKNLGDLIKAFKKLDNDINTRVIIIEGSENIGSVYMISKNINDFEIDFKLNNQDILKPNIIDEATISLKKIF